MYRDPVPPRRRKRRNPEDILLARLKRYEELLENAGVKVDPIGGAKHGGDDGERVDEHGSRQTSVGDNAGRNEPDDHGARRTQLGDSHPSESTGGKSVNPGRFIVKEGRSRYLEK